MRRARRFVAAIAAVWLSCQLTATALTPIVLFVDVATRTVECTCPPGADAHCPMHHKTQRRSKTCVMQGVNDQAAAVLVSLLGVSGSVPEGTFLGQPVLSSPVAIAASSLDVARPSAPDPPPPRA